MVTFNIIFLVLMVLALRRASIDTALAASKIKAWQKYDQQIQLCCIIVDIRPNDDNYRFRVIFCIFTLMGLSWTFQIVSYAIGLSEFHNFLREKTGVKERK